MQTKKLFRLFFLTILFSFIFFCRDLLTAAFSSNSPTSLNLIHTKPNGTQILLRHSPTKEIAAATVESYADLTQQLDLRFVLPLRNQDQLSKVLKDIYTPGDPQYHHFLKTADFVAEYAPLQSDVDALSSYLKKQGFNVSTLGQPSNRLVLKVNGSVKAIEKVFGGPTQNLHINNYKKTSDGTNFFAPDTDPIVPVELYGKIAAIAGMDNIIKFHSHAHYDQIKPKPALKSLAVYANRGGSGPNGGFSPSDIYKAYNLNGISSNGAGQTVALFELDGYLPSDIATYDNQFNLPNVPLQNKLIDGFDGNPFTGASFEVSSDIEMLTGIAPGLSSILVYMAPGGEDQYWIDEWNQIAEDNFAKIISCSWGGPEISSPNILFDYSIFQQMALQGQEVFVASGDTGAYDNGLSLLTADEPSIQPYVTGVGISVLSTNGDGSYKTEKASQYSGGGISAFHSIPDYQLGIISSASLGSMTMRNAPDLAFNADSSTGYSLYSTTSKGWVNGWGSSYAAPIWAAFNAIVNEGRINAGGDSLGFINPLLYSIAQSGNYSKDFHDIVGGISNNGISSSPYYPAVIGYDDATGLGSFNGVNLYTDLVSFDLPPVGLSAQASLSSVTLTWQASTGAVSYNVKKLDPLTGAYLTIASGLNTPTYTDNLVATGKQYYYEVSSVNNTNLESPNSAAVSAVPGPPHTVTISENFAGGSITPYGDVSVNNGSNQRFSITANSGFYIDHLIVDGTSVNVNSYSYFSYLLNNVTANHTIQVVFLPLYTITSSVSSIPASSNGGLITPSGGQVTSGVSVSVPQGQTESFTISPNNNFVIYELLVDGNAVSIPPSDSIPYAYSFTNLNANHTISAIFVSVNLRVISASTGAGGQISPSGLVSVNTGSGQYFDFYPEPGYDLAQILTDGNSITPVVDVPGIHYYYGIENVTANHVISASFMPITSYAITANASTGGNISPSGAVNVKPFANQVFTFTPNPGNVSFVSIDGSTPVPVVGNNYVLTNVVSPHTVNASFAPSNLIIVTASAQSGGLIYPSGNVNVPTGLSQSFTITPSRGNVAFVSVDGGTPAAVLGNTFSLSAVTTPHSVVALFAPANSTFIASNSIGTPIISIYPYSYVPVGIGSNQIFTIYPVPFYNLQVLVDGLTVTPIPATDFSNNPSYTYTFNNVTKPHSISAIFTPTTYAITAGAGAGGTISPSGNVNVNIATNQTFTFTPSVGYSLNKIIVDGTALTNTPHSYTFSNVTAPHTISAIFSPNAIVTINGSIMLAGNPSVLIPSGVCVPTTVTPGINFNPTGNTFQIFNLKAGTYNVAWNCQGHMANYSVTITNQQELYPITINATVVLDVTPPTKPVNLTVTNVGTGNVNLSWMASTDNVGVTDYYIFRKAGTVTQSIDTKSTATSWTDTNVTAGTQYTYSVLALDAAGNGSTRSSTIVVTVP